MYFAKPLPAYVYRVLSQRHRLLKLLLSCKVVEKNGFGPPLCKGMGYPRFRTCFSNNTYFGPYGQMWLSSLQRAPRVADEKKKERKNPPTILSGGLQCNSQILFATLRALYTNSQTVRHLKGYQRSISLRSLKLVAQILIHKKKRKETGAETNISMCNSSASTNTNYIYNQ